MASHSSNSKPKPNVYRVPKELDILPPRPVLFPWLPKNGLDCLLVPKQKKMITNERFSFDGNSDSSGIDKQGQSVSQPGTPATAPLSPNNEDEENPMPDMSTTISKVDKKEQTRGKKQQQKQLGNLTDVIAEVLRVIFFIISMKRAVLRQNGEEPRGKAKKSSKQQQDKNQSLEGTLDIV